MTRELFLHCIPAFLCTLLLTPLCTGIGWKIGALDIPADGRRMHRLPVPRIGGLAFFAGFVFAGILSDAFTSLRFSVALGVSGIFLTGLADDLFNLNAWIKFSCQTLCASVAVTAQNALSMKEKLFAVFWIVALTNAHNLIDGLDGLLAGTAVIEGAALGMALLLTGSGNYLPPFLLAAAVLGFRFYNRAPATVFAGDCGSETVGFLLGICSLPLLLRPEWGIGFLSAPLIFGYPLTDLLTAVTRRILRGAPLFGADRAHLHHRLCAAGLDHSRCTRLLNLLCAGIALTGTALCAERFSVTASVCCVSTVFLLLLGRRYVLKRAEEKTPG